MKRYVFDITPLGKPRMVQSDKWRKRKAVQAYWQYKADLEKLCLVNKFRLQETIDMVCYLPMPASWSRKKRATMAGTPHQTKPDADNILKGFLDALTTDDAKIWDKRIRKYWAETGRIVVYEEENKYNKY